MFNSASMKICSNFSEIYKKMKKKYFFVFKIGDKSLDEKKTFAKRAKMFNFVTLEKKKKNSHKYISVRLIGTTDRQTDR